MSRSLSPRDTWSEASPTHPALETKATSAFHPSQLQGSSPSPLGLERGPGRVQERGHPGEIGLSVPGGPDDRGHAPRGPGTRAQEPARRPAGGRSVCGRGPGHLPRGQRGSAAGGGAAPGRGAPGPELGSGPAAAQSREGHGHRKSRRRQPSRERGERKRRQAALGPGSGRRTRELAARLARGWAEPLGRAERRRRRRRPRGPARPPEQAARGPPGPRPEPWARPRSSTTWTGRRRRTW